MYHTELFVAEALGPCMTPLKIPLKEEVQVFIFIICSHNPRHSAVDQG